MRQLNQLTADERQGKRCDMEAMAQIASREKRFNPDKIIAYTFHDPVVEPNFIKAPGAVFRSKGEWCRLKYRCSTSGGVLDVTAFDCVIGSKVAPC